MLLLTFLTFLGKITELAIRDITFYANRTYDLFVRLTRNNFLLIFLHESKFTLITKLLVTALSTITFTINTGP